MKSKAVMIHFLIPPAGVGSDMGVCVLGSRYNDRAARVWVGRVCALY